MQSSPTRSMPLGKNNRSPSQVTRGSGGGVAEIGGETYFSLEAGTGATRVGGQVFVAVAVGDPPSEPIGECLAVLQLAGHTGALPRAIFAGSGVDRLAPYLEYIC